MARTRARVRARGTPSIWVEHVLRATTRASMARTRARTWGRGRAPRSRARATPRSSARAAI
eukprot:5189839-Alexandrium_andersonii.AAC.1